MVEVVEVEVPVESGGVLIDGVHDDSAGAELVASADAATEGINE